MSSSTLERVKSLLLEGEEVLRITEVSSHTAPLTPTKLTVLNIRGIEDPVREQLLALRISEVLVKKVTRISSRLTGNFSQFFIHG